MKLRFLFIAMIAMAVSFTACQETPEDPEDVPVTPGTSDIPKYDFPYFDEFPIEAGNLLTEASASGVTIEVTKVEDRNFVFELRPGALVQSYKFDVYPLANLYNTIINSRNSGMIKPNDPVEVNNLIRTMLFVEGSGGFSISVNDPQHPDFLQKEIDWMSTDFSLNRPAIPDCGFLISVVASSEPDISSANQEELTLCYVHTTSQPLIGDPQIEIAVRTGYRAFEVKYLPNADTEGLYFFSAPASEIDEYIDTFGEDLYRDFVRTIRSSPASPEDENLSDSFDYGDAADHTLVNAATAVAVDANLTPQEGFSRQDFTLDEMPPEEEQELAEPKITVIDERIASSYFEFYIEMPKDCGTIFYSFYTEKEKLEFDATTETKRKLEAIRLMQEGFGVHNPNFAWNKDAPDGEKATGSASGKILMSGFSEGFKPGSTIYVGFTGRNGYLTAGPLTFSEPIKLDERNYQTPDNCKVKDLKIWADNVSRSSFSQCISYDPSTVSVIHTQWIPDMINISETNEEIWVPWEEALGVTLDSPWTEWVDLIFDLTGNKFKQNRMMNINHWSVEPSGEDGWNWHGMTPDTDYVLFVCAEDYDGNISPMVFNTVRTKDIQAGPDPTMEITVGVDEKGRWQAVFKVVKDVKSFRYTVIEPSDIGNLNIPNANKNSLNNIKESGIPYETWYGHLYDFVAEYGNPTEYEQMTWEWTTDDTVIAVCVATGDGTTDPKMYHVVFKDGKTTTLEEIFGITE